MLVARTLVLIALHMFFTAQANATETDAEPKYTNRLIHSNNPYLRLHAHNPVDWYPWGEEAFAIARSENKPIFLSVGYSTCYWCHVAERQLYSNPDVAALMNKWFVNVKVDREQLPDVDRFYMIARQYIAGSGGWPNNVFLTPELLPFFAGSYFPLRDDPARGPGFPTILRRLNDAWQTQEQQVREQAKLLETAVRALAESSAESSSPVAIEPRALLADVSALLLDNFDWIHAGFLSASGTKFPQVPSLRALYSYAQQHGSERARDAVLATLRAMAIGGINDQLAGGFHRYSTDLDWSVPHFEKMLYDNAQLLELYSVAASDTKDAFLAYNARRTAEFLLHRMMDKRGGFYTAIDAEVAGVEGESYLWAFADLNPVLSRTERPAFHRLYELRDMPEGLAITGEGGVLRIRPTVAARMSSDDLVDAVVALRGARTGLLVLRDARAQPRRDEKLLVDQNGLAIRAMATAATALSEPRFYEAAERSATRLWMIAFNNESGELSHEVIGESADTPGYLSDYAQLGLAFLALAEHAPNGQVNWRERAEVLARHAVRKFVTEDGGVLPSVNHANLPISLPDLGDNDYPSGTSSLIELLLRLRLHNGSESSGAPAWVEEALQRTTLSLAGTLVALPTAWPTSVRALSEYSARTRTAALSLDGQVATTVLQSSDKVRLYEPDLRSIGDDIMALTLFVEDGFHINANPASMEFLIPTSVHIADAPDIEVSYPPPISFSPKFVDASIDVWENIVVLEVKLSRGNSSWNAATSGHVRVQACNDSVCLPPSNLPFQIPARDLVSEAVDPN